MALFQALRHGAGLSHSLDEETEAPGWPPECRGRIKARSVLFFGLYPRPPLIRCLSAQWMLPPGNLVELLDSACRVTPVCLLQPPSSCPRSPARPGL